MYPTLNTIYTVCLAVGASATFISDLFFIISKNTHVFKVHEYRILRRFNLASLTSLAIAVILEIVLLSLRIESGAELLEVRTYLKIVIMIVATLCLLAMRQIHLPQLMRYQQKYSHLSDHFFLHHDSFVATAVISSISWIFVIIMAAHDTAPLMTPIYILLIYIVILYTTSKLGVLYKKFSHKK